MVKVEAGTLLNMDEKKFGNGQHGAWCFVNAKAEKGYDRITVFAVNAEEASTFTGDGTIKEIKSVTLTSKKDQSGNWVKSYTVNAVISGKDGNAEKKKRGADDFMQIMGDDSGLPFN